MDLNTLQQNAAAFDDIYPNGGSLSDFPAIGGSRNSCQSIKYKIHVRVHQRTGKKSITTVVGLADDLNIKRICKAFKKNFNCNGVVKSNEDVGGVIQLSGDQRTNVKSFLVDQETSPKVAT